MKKEFTATVYILEQNKVLLLFHGKLKKWLPPGGHMEPNETPPEAARREVMEETGLEIEFLSQENIWIKQWNANSFERPYLCLLEEIPAFQNIPPHQHMDMIYVAKPQYNSYVAPTETMRWFDQKELDVLKPDIEIFKETLDTIQHLFEQFSVSTL